MKAKIIEYVTKEEFEKLREKFPKALVSIRKNGSKRLFIGKKVYVLKP